MLTFRPSDPLARGDHELTVYSLASSAHEVGTDPDRRGTVRRRGAPRMPGRARPGVHRGLRRGVGLGGFERPGGGARTGLRARSSGLSAGSGSSASPGRPGRTRAGEKPARRLRTGGARVALGSRVGLGAETTAPLRRVASGVGVASDAPCFPGSWSGSSPKAGSPAGSPVSACGTGWFDAARTQPPGGQSVLDPAGLVITWTPTTVPPRTTIIAATASSIIFRPPERRSSSGRTGSDSSVSADPSRPQESGPARLPPTPRDGAGARSPRRGCLAPGWPSHRVFPGWGSVFPRVPHGGPYCPFPLGNLDRPSSYQFNNRLSQISLMSQQVGNVTHGSGPSRRGPAKRP